MGPRYFHTAQHVCQLPHVATLTMKLIDYDKIIIPVCDDARYDIYKWQVVIVGQCRQ